VEGEKAPFRGAQAISEIPLWKSSDSNLVSDPQAKGTNISIFIKKKLTKKI